MKPKNRGDDWYFCSNKKFDMKLCQMMPFKHHSLLIIFWKSKKKKREIWLLSFGNKKSLNKTFGWIILRKEALTYQSILLTIIIIIIYSHIKVVINVNKQVWFVTYIKRRTYPTFIIFIAMFCSLNVVTQRTTWFSCSLNEIQILFQMIWIMAMNSAVWHRLLV